MTCKQPNCMAAPAPGASYCDYHATRRWETIQALNEAETLRELKDWLRGHALSVILDKLK